MRQVPYLQSLHAVVLVVGNLDDTQVTRWCITTRTFCRGAEAGIGIAAFERPVLVLGRRAGNGFWFNSSGCWGHDVLSLKKI